MSATAGHRSFSPFVVWTLVLGAIVLTAVAIALPAKASATATIFDYSASPSSTLAGDHPDIAVSFELETFAHQKDGELPDPCLCLAAKVVTAQLPAGVIGNPHSTPRCTPAEFATDSCPVDSQVGVVSLRLLAPDEEAGTYFLAGLFNMVPAPGQAGLLAFPAPLLGATPVSIEITARTEGDYGLETKTTGIPRIAPPNKVTVINWGVPAAKAHDPLRFPFGGNAGTPIISCSGTDPTAAAFDNEKPSGQCQKFQGVASNSAEVPFLSNPTTCAGPLSTSLDVESYDLGTDHTVAPYPETTACGQLEFNPSQSVTPTTTAADSPTGLDLDLTVPQFQSPTVPSPSEIRAVKIEFPPGLSVNANAADGKLSCTDQQARFGTRDAAQCPEHSKIGTLSIESSALPGLLNGFVYLGEPLPGDRYRTILVADGFGLHIKLAGTAHPDAEKGMTVSFPNLPQAPFQESVIHIFGGERGIFATPTRCGTYPVKTTFTPWATELGEQTATQFFVIDRGPNGQPCPGAQRPFAPGFQAGVTNNTGGAHSSFVINVSRDDGDQFLGSVDISPPPGFSGVLKGIPYCPEEAIARLQDPLYSGLAELTLGACPPASRIGTVTGGAGAGTKPLYQGGAAYLAGPYKGAPLSLIVVIPAVTGPYDVGNIATRVAIFVDPVTARVKTVSDPLPQQIDGIPLRVRSIRVDIDRENFAINPTNCEPLSVDAGLGGDEGGQVSRSAPFQVANCANLGFAPKLSLRLRGGTKRASHPALRAVLSTRDGDANLASAVVALPRAAFLDQSHIRTICTRVEFAARRCPEAAVYGRATAYSPLLDQPLTGPVYLRSSSNLLPDLVMDLRGQVDFNAIGRIDSVNGGIRSSFDFIPDIPVSKVVLDMQGGRKGLLENSRNLCTGRAPKATVRLRGQNGDRRNLRVPLKTTCGKRKSGESSGRPKRLDARRGS